MTRSILTKYLTVDGKTFVATFSKDERFRVLDIWTPQGARGATMGLFVGTKCIHQLPLAAVSRFVKELDIDIEAGIIFRIEVHRQPLVDWCSVFEDEKVSASILVDA